MSHASLDHIHRFLLDHCDLRGEIVTLHQSLHQATQHQHLPPAAQRLLGEFLAAASLVAEVLKFTGTLTLQARGAGPLPLIMAESDEQGHVRGIVKLHEGLDPATLESLSMREMLGEGVLSLTLDPIKGKRYQGIVALQGESLSECLNNYFSQSEQLPTRLWLTADTQRAAGLLLQALPPAAGETAKRDEWETAMVLADTVKPQELLQLEHSELLRRLFHEFDVRLFPPQPIAFKCHCSRERSATALTALGREDAYALLAERGSVDTQCDFCGAEYRFDQADLDALFNASPPTIH